MTETEQMQKVADEFGWATVGCEHCFCHKLMEWLEDEERGYRFQRNWLGKEVRWAGFHHEYSLIEYQSTLWSCLYSAWGHWQEREKPKEKGLREKLKVLSLGGFASPTFEETQEKYLNALESLISQHIKGKKGKVMKAIGSTLSYQFSKESVVDAIMDVFEEKEHSDEQG